MADAVTSQTLVSGKRNAVMKFTNLSDGTGESAVKKVDMSDLGASSLKVAKIHYSVTGMVVTLLWDADTDVRMVDLNGDGCFDFTGFGGLINNAGTGVTGDINLTTVGHTSGDNYTIILEMIKD